MANLTYRLRVAGSKLPAPVKAPAKSAWRAWGNFASRAYGRYYYTNATQTWKNTTWMGVPIWKNPKDLWVYQEMLWELRPDLIVETGTNYGGSAYFFASMLDLISPDTDAKVMTVDISLRKERPEHPRIEYMKGSSVSDEIVSQFRAAAEQATTVMVVLDSDHHYDHVLAELRALHSLVTVGSYLVVEDTNVNGHPVNPFFGPGPWEAVETFLAEHHNFEIDLSREKYMHTFNPRGYLKRVR